MLGCMERTENTGNERTLAVQARGKSRDGHKRSLFMCTHMNRQAHMHVHTVLTRHVCALTQPCDEPCMCMLVYMCASKHTHLDA